MSSHKTAKNSNYRSKKKKTQLVEVEYKKNKRRYAKNGILFLGVLAGCMFICAVMQWVNKSYGYMFTYAAIGAAALVATALVKKYSDGAD